jgi:Transposase IS66 family
VGELLRAITTAMGQELLSGSYIQADETTVAVQMHDGRGKNHLRRDCFFTACLLRAR